MRERAYRWWKANHELIRKPLVFVIGIVLIMTAPLVGFIPGPGGILVFLLGIAVLGSEFDWALALKSFFLKTVPLEVKKRWQPTPNWEYAFDVTTACLAVCAAIFMYYAYWLTAVYSGIFAVLLFVFNRKRLERLKAFLSSRNK
jgi:hypothetical protein